MALDFTKPVQTRNGSPVRILATDLAGNCPEATRFGRDNFGYFGTYEFTKEIEIP